MSQIQKARFKEWLIKQGKTSNTVNSYASTANSVARDYFTKIGQNIVNVYDIDDAVQISEIARQYGRGGDYEQDGERSSTEWRNSIARYSEFVADPSNQSVENGEENPTPTNSVEKTDSTNFGYERDLQTVFCSQISALFPGYNILGREYPIFKKRIDVLLEHTDTGNLLAVELKAGRASESVFGQISMYIGMLKDMPQFSNRKIKGVIIANSIDNGLLYACKTNPDISVKNYRMSLELEDFDLPDIEDTETEN